MPIIEEVEEEAPRERVPTHTTVKMGAASRLQAFAEEGGLAAFAAAQEDGDGQQAKAGAEPEECKAPTWHEGPAGSKAAGQPQPDAAAATRVQTGAGDAGPADGEGAQKELTEEEKQEQEAMLVRARELKNEGNALFGTYEYDAAILKYTGAIEAAPKGHQEQAVFFNNRATCYFKQGNYSLAIADCTAALRIDPNYAKCLLRRAQAYETEKKVCEAFDDFERILTLDPANSMAAAGSKRLKQPAEAERERMKEEMMGKLKDLGNTVLGKFGLSLDNFKATKDPNTVQLSVS